MSRPNESTSGGQWALVGSVGSTRQCRTDKIQPGHDIPDLHKIAWSRALNLACDRIGINETEVDRLSHSRFIRKHLSGQAPLDTDEVARGFRTYQARVNEARSLADSGTIERLLIDTVRQWLRVTKGYVG